MEPSNIVETGITISDWLMIVAVILGPILAVQIQKFIDRRAEDRNKKLRVFRDLMTTRATTLAFQHVSALNMVGLEFNGKKYTKVVNAWKTYLDHLASYPKDDENMQKIWAEKKDDQLSDLLYEMGESLGFQFDKVHIKKAGYSPQAYADQEFETNFIRRKIVEMFLGEGSIPMAIKQFPVDEELACNQKELFKLMKEHYEGNRSISIKLDNGES